jgi:gamma-glutamyltranspeptidase/glutathione hydrolase
LSRQKASNMISSLMPAARTALTAENGMVTGGHAQEAEAGVRMLQAGGNAVDAVVAAAFTGYVVEPASCGLGGYGRLALFLDERQEFITVDHRIRAPGRSRPDMFEIEPSGPSLYFGHPQTVGRKAEWGHLAAAVPGAVSGLCAAHEMFGRLPLARVMEPAIEAAEAGLPVTWDLVLYINNRLEQIRALPHTAAWLLRAGDPPRYGGTGMPADRLDQSELAGTLKRIAQHGPAGFYAGPVAAAIEREFAQHGGLLTAADLAAYRPRILREKPAAYRGYTYITADDPVSYEALSILSHFDLRRFGPDSTAYRHLVAEAFGHAFADNMAYYGDPEFTRSPVHGLASPAFAAARAAGIRLDRAAPRPIAAADPWPFEPAGAESEGTPPPTTAARQGTTQMLAADREGNLAVLITTLESGFGSLVLVPGTGILMNNSMSNYDPRPGHPNCIQPGKMPIFGVPTLAVAKDGRAVFGAGGSGGYRILTGVLHAMLHTLDFGMDVRAAVDAPRVHCQGGDTYVDARIPAQVQAELAALGHMVVPQLDSPGSVFFGRVNALSIEPETRLIHAGTGPAWVTAAAGH